MNWPALLTWFIGLSCGLMIFSSLKNSGIRSLWFWKSLGLLALVIFHRLIPDPLLWALLVGIWLLLFLIPTVVFSQIQRAVALGNFQQARRDARWVSRLHPGDGWPDYPDILGAMDLVKQGQVDLALVILNRYKEATSPIAIQASLTLFRVSGRWAECLEWIEALPAKFKWQQSPSLSTAYARALAENQDYDQLFPFLERKLPQMRKKPKEYHQMMIIALAFGGEVMKLQRLFRHSSTAYRKGTQAYWVATAAMVLGRLDMAKAEFQKLRSLTDDQALVQAIDSRLRSPLAPTQSHISHQLQQGFAAIDQLHAPSNQRYNFGQHNQGKHWITWLLLGANLLMFFLEVQQGGSQNGRVLYQLGGLWPPDVWQGQYWRLITVNFLHAGSLHLAMNMIGLLILGPFVEQVMGRLRFCLIYAVSGIGAGIGIAYLPLWLNFEPEFTVGASGAIMGLVGAIAAITLWGWLVERAEVAAKKFRTVLIMVGFQVVFDFSTPQISITGHLSGLVVGFVSTLLIISILGFKKSSAPGLA